MLLYKCELEGIRVIVTEESYTSKVSFLDSDPIPVYGKEDINKFSGNRINRGLYKSGKGILINADLNGSYNILRKAKPEAFADGIEGFVVNPVKISICSLSK